MLFPSMKNFCQVFFILSFTFIILPGQSLIAGETLKKFEQELQSLIESNKTSIVTVTSHFSHEISVEKQNGFLSFFKTDIQKKEWSFINVGTGLIFDKDGHVITKSSIVIGSEINNVTFADGVVLTAKLIGHDPETGFAVIKLEPNEINLIPVKLGKCEGIMPGSWNFILGNSLGVYPSVVFGSVNAIRSDGMIQLSANLNPGNNGSPIINLKGEIIGLVAGQLQTSSETLVNFAELNPT